MKKTIFTNTQQLFKQYKTPILYSGGSIVKAVTSMLVGFIIARYVTPDDLGLWASLGIAISYSALLQAGIINGLNLELPYAYGRGEEDKAKIIAGSVQTVTVISSIIILIIGLGVFTFLPVENNKIKYGILAMTLVISLTFYQNYLTSTFRSNSSFLKLSLIQIVSAFVNLISLILVVYYSYFGIIIKAVLVIFLNVLFLHLIRPIKVKLLWNKPILLKILKVGLPIFGLSYIEMLALTTDKLWLLKYADLADVGLYSFAFYAYSVFSLLSLSVATYIYPRMTYNFGKNNDKMVLWKYAKKITIILFLAQILMAIVGYFIIPYVISNFFPAYTLSIPIMQILIFAGVFTGSSVGANILWSIKSWKHMIIYKISFAISFVLFPYFGILLFANKLEGVAYGVLLACVLNLISGITWSFFATHNKTNK